jgi:DHA1 family multidrug resistance protein-like MFS transporter
MAYVGDNSPEKERSAGMGQLGAATGVGIVIGPLLGGFLSADSLSLPFFIGAGLACLAFLLVIFVLPESHARQADPDKPARPTFDVLRQTFFSPVGVLLLLILVMSFGLTSFQGITGLYVIDKFAFNTKQVGAIWMVMGGMLILVQGALTGPLTKRFGETALIRLGLIGGALGFLAMSLAVGYSTTLLALGFFTCALALTGPALNAYLSGFAGERQGAVMGLNSAATSLGRVIGPLWAGYLYEVNIEFPYLSGAAALVLGLLLSWFGLRQNVNREARLAITQDVGKR